MKHLGLDPSKVLSRPREKNKKNKSRCYSQNKNKLIVLLQITNLSALCGSGLDPVPAGPVFAVALGLEFVRKNSFATRTVEIENLYLQWLVKNVKNRVVTLPSNSGIVKFEFFSNTPQVSKLLEFIAKNSSE